MKSVVQLKNIGSRGDVKAALEFIRKRVKAKPSLAIILGSGLGDFGKNLSKKTILDVSEIPQYPRLTVEGHGGKLIFGDVGDTTVLAFQGRIHYYEVGALSPVLFPIHIAYEIGIKTLLVTNAAGGVNKNFRPADLMLLTDQINFTFENPLLKISARTADKQKIHTPLYDESLQIVVEESAREKNIPLHRGVYCGVKGPSYETAAEVEMIRRLGGDAVGMSTINEVSAAREYGMRVAGISCITNLATGLSRSVLSHHEVKEVANQVRNRFADLVHGFVKRTR